MTVMNYRRVCVYVYVCEHTGTVSVTVAQTSNFMADYCYKFLSELTGLYKTDT